MCLASQYLRGESAAVFRHVLALFWSGPGRFPRARILTHPLWTRRRGDHAAHARIAQDELEQRLRPRLYTEGREWCEHVRCHPLPRERPLAERAHHDDADPEVRRGGKDHALGLTVARVVRDLDLFDLARAHQREQLGERRVL